MTQKVKDKPNRSLLIKFIASAEFKRALEELARERNIALSSLLRLIASEYLKRSKS